MKLFFFLLILTDLTLRAQSPSPGYNLQTVHTYKLKHLKVPEEDFREPLTFEDPDYVYYIHNGKHSGNMNLWKISKRTGKTASISCRIEDSSFIQPTAFMVVKRNLYITAFNPSDQLLVKYSMTSGNQFEPSASIRVNFVPNTRNLILLKDSVILISSFYYPDLTIPNINNLNLETYSLDLVPLDTCSLNLGLTAASSIHPQHYFFVKNDSLFFLSPSDGRIYKYVDNTMQSAYQVKVKDVKLISPAQEDSLQHFAARTGIMNTYWKLQDYLKEQGSAYFFFLDPIAPDLYLLGIRDVAHNRWTLLDKNFTGIPNQTFVTEISNLNEHDYFSYYYTHIPHGNDFATISIRKGKFWPKKYFYYTRYTLAR